jgi:hypothetical protein
MSDPWRVLALLIGIAIVAGTVVSVFGTLVVPRATSSRVFRTVLRTIAKVVKPLLRVGDSYVAKDRIMAWVGPLGMVLVFVLWLILLIIGFGLMMWWATGGDATLWHAFAIAGSSVFTLGVLSDHRGTAEWLEFMTAGAGLLVIALEIAYLPALYQAYAQRETEVTLLAARSGTPAWGPEILARHTWFKTTAELPDLYRTWERWAAAIAESHANYPSLMWFRSPVPERSWLLSLVAMMDAAALSDALAPEASPRQARIFLMMGVRTLRSLCDALNVAYDADPLPTDPLRLTYEEFLEGTDRLALVDYPFERTPEEAWPHFRGWRVNYEALLDALTAKVVPPPAPWLADRPRLGTVEWPRVLNRTPEDPHAQKPLRT